MQTLPYVNSLSIRGRDIAFQRVHTELDRRDYRGPRPGRQLYRLTDVRISAALYAVDPVHTCCKENDCTDEYDRVARSILKRVQRHVPLHVAITEVLAANFSLESQEVPGVQDVIDVICGVSFKNSESE
jgi:hypothetical protein